MSCFGDCLEMGPPPDTILFMPPPPAPLFVVPDLLPSNVSHCFTAQICDPATPWTAPGKTIIDHGEFIELPRKDIETNWNVSGIDDTWILVLVASSIGVLLLGALLAMFLLKCREMNILGSSDHCSLHSRDHQSIKNLDPRDGALTSLNSKLIHPNDSPFYNGMASVQDNRMVWAALTPRGTQHFISESYPRDLIDYGETDDHYETIENITTTNRSLPNHKSNIEDYFSHQKDYDYEDPTPLIESYQMNQMDNVEEHQYQVIGNTDMRCASFGLGTNSLRRPYPVIRPRVSSPTRIEHPNLPPLNLYPQRSNNNTLRKSTASYRNMDAGVVPKYGI
ncbi:uncharacterized protein LOC143191104 isoform X1 [Rhynchophorus ferrugineus]|uniref:uncharacterized protein LOC143191104 isoform X1 n=1 Tax=Rhynchophorus ferrugineus TaxID=354439 RepID=UPI003FCDE040